MERRHGVHVLCRERLAQAQARYPPEYLDYRSIFRRTERENVGPRDKNMNTQHAQQNVDLIDKRHFYAP